MEAKSPLGRVCDPGDVSDAIVALITGSDLVTGTVVPVAFAVLYAVVIAQHLGRGEGNFNSLAGVAALFANPWNLLAGWVHYLAFDLLTGVWETRDAAKRGIPHWMVIPCLLLTFMLGPAGWLLYQGVRKLRSA